MFSASSASLARVGIWISITGEGEGVADGNSSPKSMRETSVGVLPPGVRTPYVERSPNLVAETQAAGLSLRPFFFKESRRRPDEVWSSSSATAS